jgi:hypothetical protein
MQRQVQWPEHERPRVPLIIDEAHYVLGGENIVDQFATHRRAGLEPVCTWWAPEPPDEPSSW